MNSEASHIYMYLYRNIDTHTHRKICAQIYAHAHTHTLTISGRCRTRAKLQVLFPVLLPDEGTFDAVWGSGNLCIFVLILFFDFQHIRTLIFKIFNMNMPNEDLHLFFRYIGISPARSTCFCSNTRTTQSVPQLAIERRRGQETKKYWPRIQHNLTVKDSQS